MYIMFNLTIWQLDKAKFYMSDSQHGAAESTIAHRKWGWVVLV